jgi:ABC-type amino acid transport substrate-binding protein
LLHFDRHQKHILAKAPSSIAEPGEVFDQILNRGILRVGYNPQTPPFCFYNNQGNIVGYDMAFAYELAQDLGCSLELVPMNYGQLVEDLNSNLYDIAMSAVSINEERLKNIYFTRPYIDAKIVFVMQDSKRKKFTSQEAINAAPKTKIAVLKDSAYEAFAHDLFPNNEIVPIESFDSFAEKQQADLLLWEEQEAISWALHHPHFQVVFPKKPIGTDSLGYAMKANNPRLLNYMNQWLKLIENDGFTEKVYNLWILGETKSMSPHEPRWSIIRDVLHWVD